MDQKDEIKSRLDVVEVIREYIPLKAVGVNFQARCPFHQEKTPSFVVSPERQIWKCFGCGKGGDVFSFVMEMEGLSFVEALRQLAPKAGVTLRRQNAQEASRRNSLLDCVEFAVNYFHKVLIESDDARGARDYLQKRGLTQQTIEEFKIGYSKDSWDDLYNILRQKGFNDDDIFLAGLSVKKEKGLGYYNRFRGRIMFPVNDINGNPVAFSARVSPEREQTEKQGKYINSPQSRIYDKSKILFGLDKAKQSIRQEDAVILAEGQMDVISSFQAGIKNIAASSGTALSIDQIKLLKRYTKNILFSFDMDSAGQMAAERGIVQTLQEDMNIKIIQVPDGKDPDECVRHDINEWKKAIANARSVIDYYFEKTFTAINMNDMAEKKKAAAKILNIIANISNPIEQDGWFRRLADALMTQEESLRDILKINILKHREKHVPNQPRREADKPSASREQVLAESLFALILKFFHFFETAIDSIALEMFEDKKHRIFYKMLIFYYNNNAYQKDRFNSGHFKEWLKNNIKDEKDLVNLNDFVDMLLLLADKDFYDLQDGMARKEINRIIFQLKRKYLSNKMLQIEQQLSVAEKNGDEKNVVILTADFHKVLSDIKSLNQ